MLITKPSYFDTFRCIASACPDSCCKEWDVQVDADSARFYRVLPGDLGDRLRQVLYDEDGQTYLAIEDGRCPMWRTDGLCRIQAEQGEAALCKTCREFPRLTHDYGDFIERGLELSCPEAARIILSAPAESPMTEEIPGYAEPEYDLDAMAVLKRTRQVMLALLADTRYSLRETLTLALLYGYHAQEELDGEEERPFLPEDALETARSFAREGSMQGILAFFLHLEILTAEWRSRLENPGSTCFPAEVRLLARYFVERYWLQAVSDYDLSGRVKFLLIACLVICSLGGDFVSTAQLFSKEIENNCDNMEAILDAAYTSPLFTDDKLLGLLLGIRES